VATPGKRLHPERSPAERLHGERLRTGRLVALFLLGGLLFDAPLLRVASGDAWLGGMPRAWVYLFGAWACLITLIALAARAPAGD
jgi:hypothetical protein